MQAAHVGAGGGRAPLVIGDSTMIFAAPVLGGLGLEADAHGCRPFAEGVRMLAARKANGTLPQRRRARARSERRRERPGAIKSALGRHGTRPRAGPRHAAQHRERRRGDADRRRDSYPGRIRLIDWVSFSAGHEGWFAGDGLHVNHEGASAYAHLIKDAVAPLAFPPVAALKMPDRAAGTVRCGAVQPRRAALPRVRHAAQGAHPVRPRPHPRADRGGCGIPGWRVYDWHATGNGPWDWVLARERPRGRRRARRGLDAVRSAASPGCGRRRCA